MPVTAKLSRKFYETFGDDIANELVEWFNQVDATYRSEFRELFDVHFARFDAKLEQRVGELNAKLEQRIAEIRAELRQELAELRTSLHAAETRLIRWMFLFWVGTLGTLLALRNL